MIRLEAVTFGYPAAGPVLAGIDLEVRKGESLGVSGANGSGKSTLLRLLNGLLRPSGGRVILEGRDTAGVRVAQLSRVVGLVFQEPDDQLFHSTVGQEVVAGAASPAAAERALDLVGLSGRVDAHPHDLGYSRRKLLTIAAVVAMETALVALDEPTVGQDEPGRQIVAAVVTDLLRSGRTVIVAGHDRDFMLAHLERTVTLAAGRLQ